MPVIHTVQLSKRYGDTLALDELDLEVAEGDLYGLSGAQRRGQDGRAADRARDQDRLQLLVGQVLATLRRRSD